MGGAQQGQPGARLVDFASLIDKLILPVSESIRLGVVLEQEVAVVLAVMRLATHFNLIALQDGQHMIRIVQGDFDLHFKAFLTLDTGQQD